MSVDSLQAMMGAAIVDREFCEQLLRSPVTAVGDFDLSAEERTAVFAIRATDLQQFAAQLHHWLCHRSDPETRANVRAHYRYGNLLRQAG